MAQGRAARPGRATAAGRARSRAGPPQAVRSGDRGDGIGRGGAALPRPHPGRAGAVALGRGNPPQDPRSAGCGPASGRHRDRRRRARVPGRQWADDRRPSGGHGRADRGPAARQGARDRARPARQRRRRGALLVGQDPVAPARPAGWRAMTPFELSCAAVALLLMLNLFVRFERSGRSDRTLQAVLATIVVDAALNPLSFATPTGLFKLQVGPYSVFLLEVVIGLALAARLSARRPVTRWSADMLWRTSARRAGLSLVTIGLVAVLLLPVSLRLTREPATAVPLVGQIRQSFVRPAKQQSWQSRRNQWAVAPTVVAEHPWVGSGLGTRYWHYELAENQLIETDVTHNLALDLLLRTGVIGLSLFLLALSLSLRNGLMVVRLSPDDVGAALCVGLVAVVAGLLAKGMVESILEKYRIAVLLGLSLGALRGAAAPLRSRPPDASQSLPALAKEGGELGGTS